VLTVPLPDRVLVSGATSGIGDAIARLFLGAGSTVGIIGSRPASVETAITHLDSPHAIGLAADVRDEAQVAQAVERFARTAGGIDALVCAAGVDGDMGADLAGTSSAGMGEVFDINVVGPFRLIQAALPHLQDSEDASVTLIGSDSGFVAAPGMISYNASKGALVQLTRALAMELLDEHGIRLNSVCPSITDTPMARRGLGDAWFDHPTAPVCTPADIAYCVASLASPLARAVNGVSLLADFGYHGRSSFPA
jgi:dihydroanticapsin dehydrogenase